MTRTIIRIVAVLMGMLFLAGTVPAPLFAQQPAITVDLQVNQYTVRGADLPVTVLVTNNDGHDLLMSKGFGSGVYYMKMRVIDPLGRLLLPVFPSPPPEQPAYKDSLPLPVIDVDGKVYQLAPCEPFASGTTLPPSHSGNIRPIYRMTLPGYYSAQVQIDAAVFNGEPCSINDFRWQGVLKSETKYFFYEGDTPISLSLTNWPPAWTDNSYATDLLAVTLSPPAPMTNYDLKSFRLNGIATEGDAVISGSTLIAYFSKQKAYGTLSNPIVGQGYPVSVTGLTTSGGVFGGAQLVNAVSSYTFNGFISPVDNPPTVNTARAGQAVPVKWQISGGTSVPSSTDSASFKSLTSYGVNCTSLTGVSESVVEQYAAGSSGLQNLGGGYWQYNWATSRSYAGTCRKMVLILNDGTSHEALFKFK
jgi:hypothetical protein